MAERRAWIVASFRAGRKQKHIAAELGINPVTVTAALREAIEQQLKVEQGPSADFWSYDGNELMQALKNSSAMPMPNRCDIR